MMKPDIASYFRTPTGKPVGGLMEGWHPANKVSASIQKYRLDGRQGP
jgi:hypothetical protein